MGGAREAGDLRAIGQNSLGGPARTPEMPSSRAIQRLMPMQARRDLFVEPSQLDIEEVQVAQITSQYHLLASAHRALQRGRQLRPLGHQGAAGQRRKNSEISSPASQ